MTDSLSQHCPNCEAQAAEIERLTFELAVASEPSPYCPICGSCGIAGCCGPKRCLYPTTDQDDQIETLEAEIEKLREALEKIARLRTDLSGDFSLGSHQSDIARAALGETK